MIRIQEFAGAITQILLGREVDGAVYYWTAAYLVDGLLVDTGCAYTAAELTTWLRGRRVEQAINTHHHEDHVGGNALIQKELQLEIFAPVLSVPLINRRPLLHHYQELVWGFPEPSTVKALPDVVATPRFTFRVLQTPGHCPDHISLYEPDRGWLFSGDLFVSENQKVFREDEDIYTILESQRRLLELPAERLTLFTSIGRVFDDGKASISAFLDYMDNIRSETVRLAAAGHDAARIRESIFGRESGMSGLTGGHYSVINLVQKLLAGPGGLG